MTSRTEIAEDARYGYYLDHGFVGLVETMGSDDTVEQSARLSYGKGTRKVGDTRGLIRTLVRNWHTSPLEMAEVRFHLKIPIFVMRQLVRHRTASLNEYSGRYSEMVDEFYIPPLERMQVQSTTNKQGSGEALDGVMADALQKLMKKTCDDAFYSYSDLLKQNVSRELARIVLPVNNYTEIFWKCDIKNFFGMLKLRLDPHAQKEIVDLADIMYQLAKPYFPILCEAFEDYWLNGVSFSAMEMEIIRTLMEGMGGFEGPIHRMLSDETQKMSKREKEEFVAKLQTKTG